MNLLTGESIDIIIPSICCVSNSTDMLLLKAALPSLVGYLCNRDHSISHPVSYSITLMTVSVSYSITMMTVSVSYSNGCIC